MKTEEQIKLYYQKKAKNMVDNMFRAKVFANKNRNELHGIEDLLSFVMYNADATGRLAIKKHFKLL